MTHSLDGWEVRRPAELEWLGSGDHGDAGAKKIAIGDGIVIALVEAQAGYVGSAHAHANTECLYVAAAGSQHTDTEAETPSTNLIIFKL